MNLFKKSKNAFVFSTIVVALVLLGFKVNRNTNKLKVSQLCFKYATKKCNFKSKDKARLICNTLVSHNTKISGIKHHKECRKDL